MRVSDASNADTLSHDELCLEVVERRASIALAFCPEGLPAPPSVYFDCPWPELGFELEAPTGRGFVDVMILWEGKPILCVEVKSEKDSQQPGGWLRQVKFYSTECAAPALIAVAHDLTPLQVRYFTASKMSVLDLRTMKRVA